jgi:hypothetical protein
MIHGGDGDRGGGSERANTRTYDPVDGRLTGVTRRPAAGGRVGAHMSQHGQHPLTGSGRPPLGDPALTAAFG